MTRCTIITSKCKDPAHLKISCVCSASCIFKSYVSRASLISADPKPSTHQTIATRNNPSQRINFSGMRIILFALLLLPPAHSMCPKGSFIDATNNGRCTLCPGGTYNNLVNASRCKICPAGGYTDSSGSTSRKDCKDCPPGMILRMYDVCETCGPGTYNPFINGRTCFKCPRGTFSNTYNPSYCSPCRAGRVNNKRDASLCTLCKGSRYQPLPGQKFCIPCPKGATANPDGASCKRTCNPRRRSCRICPKGKELTGEGNCVSCPEGTINAYPSITKCQPCPDALRAPFILPAVLVPNKARTRCVCRPGEFLSLNEPFFPMELNPVCGKCPKGKSSNGVKCFK